MMNISNPRKQLRKNINHLNDEMTLLKQRLRKFEKERDRLILLEKTGTIEEATKEVKAWLICEWNAYPVYD